MPVVIDENRGPPLSAGSRMHAVHGNVVPGAPRPPPPAPLPVPLQRLLELPEVVDLLQAHDVRAVVQHLPADGRGKQEHQQTSCAAEGSPATAAHPHITTR